jgi:hypothetical protein
VTRLQRLTGVGRRREGEPQGTLERTARVPHPGTWVFVRRLAGYF